MRFGLATRDITPDFPTLMGGYGARKDTYDGVNDPLTFTAIVLEEGGQRAFIGAADLCTVGPDETVSRMLDALAEVVGCPRDNIMLNASHTHGGPMMPSDILFFRGLDDSTSERYAAFFAERVMEAAREAAEDMIEGTLWYGEGKTALPMNRRALVDGKILNAPNPDGPTDGRLQLLVFKNVQGNVAAVGARVACHPVATGAQHLLTADYPGAWRAEFTRAFGPEVTPFFLQGAGADARPHHAAAGEGWRHLKHTELPQIGRELLADTLAVLTGETLMPVAGLILQGKINVISAPCERLNTRREHFTPLLQSQNGYESYYAKDALRRLDAGEEIPDHIGFKVQTLWLNREFALIGLDVEPLHALGYAVAAAVGPRKALLLGYTNGCVCYAPDSAEAKRGGYETTSYIHSVWTGPLKPGLEKLFADAVVPAPPAT